MSSLSDLKAWFKKTRNVIGYGILVVAISFALAGDRINQNDIRHEARQRAAVVATEARHRASIIAHEGLVRDYTLCTDTNKRFDNARSVFLATQKDAPYPAGMLPSQKIAIDVGNARKRAVRVLIAQALPDAECGPKP